MLQKKDVLSRYDVNIVSSVQTTSKFIRSCFAQVLAQVDCRLALVQDLISSVPTRDCLRSMLADRTCVLAFVMMIKEIKLKMMSD